MEMITTERLNEGPCGVCGRRGYPMSVGGPSICPDCDMGIDPRHAKARRDLQALSTEHLDALLALQIALNFKVENMTPQMRERGEKFIARFMR